MLHERLGNQNLVRTVIATIQANPLRAISFWEYMNLCLYHPQYGYYMSDRQKIGRAGDFYTSANIGSVMGEMIAEAYVRTGARSTNGAGITEWGAGTGQLARDILAHLQAQFPDIYEHLRYNIIETSGHHRLLQRECLTEHLERIRWLSEEEWIKHGPYADAFVFSNELLDAFPVHRVRGGAVGVDELYVTWDDATQTFRELAVPLADGPVLRYLAEQAIRLLPGQEAEVNLAAADWIRHVGARLSSGVLMTIDYGDVTEELIAPHRLKGTLLCYRNHLAADNPYEYLGVQDITSHVNFSALIAAGKAAGFQEWRFKTQKQFLLDGGILAKLANHTESDPFHPAVRRNRAIRQLLLSDQMSELFKVLEQTKYTESAQK